MCLILPGVLVKCICRSYERVAKGQADGHVPSNAQRMAIMCCPLASPKCSFPRCLPMDRFARETDDGFYSSHVAVVFFSGFRARVVEAKLPAIFSAFPNIETMLAYGSDHIDALMGNPSLIRNRAKITSVVENAGSFRSIIDRYGSFRAYLRSFNEGFPEGSGDPTRILGDLDRLQADLMNRLAYFGPATTRHFLMDYGFSFIKPDVHVMRMLHRLGLVRTTGEGSYQDAVRIGRLIADAVDVPIRYVDTVLVSLGMTSEANVCRRTEPRCGDCLLRSRCTYQSGSPASSMCE